MNVTIFSGFNGPLPITLFVLKNDSDVYAAILGNLTPDMTFNCELVYGRTNYVQSILGNLEGLFASNIPGIAPNTALVKAAEVEDEGIVITTRHLALEKYLGVIPVDFGGGLSGCYNFLASVGISISPMGLTDIDVSASGNILSLPKRNMDSTAAWAALNNDEIFRVNNIDADEEDSIKKADYYKELDYYATHEQPGIKSIQMFLAGPPSAGKTSSVSVFAKAHNLPFFGITCGPELSVDDTTSQLTPTTTSAGLLHWYDMLTNFGRVISVENGVGLIDEAAALNHGLAHQLNSLLEYPYCLTVRGITYYRHPKSIIFVAGNSGLGNGRSDFLPSLISRLYTISVPDLKASDVRPYMEKIWGGLVTQPVIDKALDILFKIKNDIIPRFNAGCKSSYGAGITFRTVKAVFGQFVGAEYHGEVRSILKVADTFIRNNTYNGDYTQETYRTSIAMIEVQCKELDKLIAASGIVFDPAWLNPVPAPVVEEVIGAIAPNDPTLTGSSSSSIISDLVHKSVTQDPNKI